MALSRRSGMRNEANIWPGFVDAMTALLLILMFVLTIFMIVQFVLRDTIVGQETELDSLSGQVAQLADALGLEQQRTDNLETGIGELSSQLSDAETQAAAQAALIASLSDQRDQSTIRIASFEEQVASLLAQNTDLTTRVVLSQEQVAELLGKNTDLSAQVAQNEDDLTSQSDTNAALNLALAQARSEIDQETQAARLAAARREAMEALIADLRSEATDREETLDETQTALSQLERNRLTEAAAAQALRERLEGATDELTAMTLSLEAERKRAEDTLTLLAAAEAARDNLSNAEIERLAALSEIDRNEALLAQANKLLAEEEALSAQSQRQVALLNQQTGALNQQLSSLQNLLDESEQRDSEAQIQLESLGSNLNTALAQVAQEQRRRADLEEAERKRLEAEAKNLANYRSEFFGRVREILGAREGVEIVGDRFVFSSEVLFERGSADLGIEGRAQIAQVAQVIREIRGEIPEGIDWILRVDGHTDNVPLGGGRYADNWELSQARALSVVQYMINSQDIPPNRLAANGFGEFQPVDNEDSDEARARNRRIELKFTER